ncbi:major facilitator superfamily domain-containing protein [Lactifluus subvellereus]|nr:major facilitator superfamily domain-containing protein [Lactifluus subvellereus]
MTYSRLSTDDRSHGLDDSEENNVDSSTPLDRTIDRIGMGTYQWMLVSLCGFGWMADNMWMQAIAIILPRVQRHFALPDNQIGILSSTMFAGMMFGAVGWGTYSDLMGRIPAFNATLFLTSLFGISASFATSFPMLCVTLFFLGSAIGGSMPTDGTILLENIPAKKDYLVTALSVFCSLGSVLAAVVAIISIPNNSCEPLPAPCDLDRNLGWKYELAALGLITLAMFLARIVFFRLHESPRYLVHAGRPQDALETLRMISKFNGSELELDLKDVEDHIHVPPPHQLYSATHSENSPTSLLFDADAEILTRPTDTKAPLTRAISTIPLSSEPPDGVEGARLISDYSATGESGTPLTAHAIASPTEHHSFPYPPTPTFGRNSSQDISPPTKEEEVPEDDIDTPPVHPRPPRGRAASVSSVRSSLYEVADCAYWALPRGIRRPVLASLRRFTMVLEPEWRGTTLLVWGVWCTVALAYHIFNVYLPKLLETRRVATPGETKSLERTLWEVVIFTIGGCPGALLGAWLIELPRLGKRLSLTGSIFSTALLCAVFALARDPFLITATTVGINLSATTMWAVLSGWTPDLFVTKVRGTACGAALALSRISGMAAPMVGGMLLMINPAFPVIASAVVFALAGFCALLLKENKGGGAKKSGRAAMVH